MFSKTYLMLLVSVFTFFGLSGIQNISYFTDWMGDVKISFNVTAEEEENEGSSNEIKEVKEKLVTGSTRFSLQYIYSEAFCGFKSDFLTLHKGYLEVFSPPPEMMA